MSKRKKRIENMKKKIESILAKTQLHKIEAASLAKTEESMASQIEVVTEPEPVEELQVTEPEPVEELKVVTEPEPVEEVQVTEPIYTSYTSLFGWDGDMMQKNKIFNRCADNGIITKRDATDLKEKLIILDSIIPKIIVDDSVANSELFEKLKKQGYDGMCLGKDSPDDIFLVAGGKNAVLVIEEKEFYEKIGDKKVYHVPIFISQDVDMVNYNVGKIVAHMQLFEKLRK